MRNTLPSVIIKHELKDGLDAEYIKNRIIHLATEFKNIYIVFISTKILLHRHSIG